MPMTWGCQCCHVECDPDDFPQTEIEDYTADDFTTGNITPWGGSTYLKYWGVVPSVGVSTSGRPRRVNFRSGVRGNSSLRSTCRTNFIVRVVRRSGAYYYGVRQFTCRRDGQDYWFRFKLFYCNSPGYLTWWITKTDDAAAKEPPEDVFSADTSVYLPLLEDSAGTRYKITPQKSDLPNYDQTDIRDQVGDTFTNSGNNPDGLLYTPIECSITASGLASGQVKFFSPFPDNVTIVQRSITDLSKLHMTGSTIVSLTGNFGYGQFCDTSNVNTGNAAVYELVLSWYHYISADAGLITYTSPHPWEAVQEGMALLCWNVLPSRWVELWGVTTILGDFGSPTIRSYFMGKWEHQDGAASDNTMEWFGDPATYHLVEQATNGVHLTSRTNATYEIIDMVLPETLTLTVTDDHRVFD